MPNAKPRSPREIATIVGIVFLLMLLFFFYRAPDQGPKFAISRGECEENLRHFRATVRVMGTGKETSAEQLEAQTERLAADGLPHEYVARSERELRERGCQ